MKVKYPLKADADGFLSQECPYCNKVFKAAFGKGSRKPLSYCPYCGAQGQNCWFTTTQMDYLRRAALKHPSTPRKPPAESDGPSETFRFPCHRDVIKHEGSDTKLSCIVCGERAS